MLTQLAKLSPDQNDPILKFSTVHTLLANIMHQKLLRTSQLPQQDTELRGKGHT